MKQLPFTRYLAEESVGYAKLKDKKFRKIRYNEAEQAIMTDQDDAAIAGVSLYIEENPESYDKSYYKAFSEIKNSSFTSIGDDEDFEIFYSFSGAIRGSRKYGNANWSARFLYEFLCTGFNGGEHFIDTYLERVFPYRPVYRKLTGTVRKIRKGIKDRWNDGNLKGGQWAAFYKYQADEMEYLQSALSIFSREVRQDIVLCLSAGHIPLNFSLARSTVNKRLSLGLSGDSPFYATSWLINQLDLHIILGDANAGMMFFSDTYKGAR